MHTESKEGIVWCAWIPFHLLTRNIQSCVDPIPVVVSLYSALEVSDLAPSTLEDKIIHTNTLMESFECRCATAYAFDWSFLETALGPHNKLVNTYPIDGRSLDHS